MKLKKQFAILLLGMLICTLTWQLWTVRGRAQEDRRGQIVNSYDEVSEAEPSAARLQQAPSQKRPAWAEDALERSYRHLDQNRQEETIRRTLPETLTNVREDLKLFRARQDDLGYTHVRLNQYHHGVPVYGGQLIAHLKETAFDSVSGQLFGELPEETTPAMDAAQAIALVRQSLPGTEQPAGEAVAKLVILPKRFVGGEKATGGILTYQVELQATAGGPETTAYQYFVDAQTGPIVKRINTRPSGTGYSLYNGTVQINTHKIVQSTGVPVYSLIDSTRGSLSAWNMNTNIAFALDGNKNLDSWGDGTTNNVETVAVDAYWGAQMSWDYFLGRFGRKGYDDKGTEWKVGVHWGTNLANAMAGNPMVFGDGNLTYHPTDNPRPSQPWVSLDVVGHEFTHNVTRHEAALIYENESGALNESFSDIFGTAIEFFAKPNGNYLIAEQVYVDGLGLRSMANPPSLGQPNHYSNYVTRPNDEPNDFGGVHTNSGIQNMAFFLLAEGGTHPISNLTVTGIGRVNAERIFYRALTTYLVGCSQFPDARDATVKAAADLFGVGSQAYTSTLFAWDAVGVGSFMCSYSLSANGANASGNGGAGNVVVSKLGLTQDTSCTTLVTSNRSWLVPITTVLPIGGNTATVQYSVQPNPYFTQRTATLTIDDQSFTVTQERCEVSLPTANAVWAKQGGQGSFPVTGICNNWYATSNASWIKIVSGASGSGNGTVTYSVDPNTTSGISPRTGTIQIYGKTFTIEQQANACFPFSMVFGQTVNGELGQVQDCYSTVGLGARYADRYMFVGAAGQPVAATMNSTEVNSYLRLIGPSGTVIASEEGLAGSLNARLPAGRYFNLPASGLYIIEATVSPTALPHGGKYSINLSTGCDYTFSMASYAARAAGATGSVGLTAGSNCAWTAASDVPWISLTGALQGVGNGTVSFSVAKNTSSQGRTGTITVSGKKFTVQQAGSI